LKPPSRENRAEAIGLFERALALDPQSVEAQSRLATALAARVLDNMTDMAAADVVRAERLAGQALAASSRSPLAHFAKGQVLRAQGRPEEAIPEYETALASDRNWVNAYNALGYCKLYTGSIDGVIPLVGQAIHLSPRDPEIGNCYFRIGQVHMVQSRTDEAIVWLEKARRANPRQPKFHAYLASAYALKGETERAAVELVEARRLSGDDRYSSIARLKPPPYIWGSQRPSPCSKSLSSPACARLGCRKSEALPPLRSPAVAGDALIRGRIRCADYAPGAGRSGLSCARKLGVPAEPNCLPHRRDG
jgi:Flp pilus assembly protein TadD